MSLLEMRFGLVGLQHGAFYREFVKKTGAIVALCDFDEKKLDWFARTIKLKRDHCYTDYQAMAFREPMKVVIDATGPDRKPTELNLQLGRHVFCENPLAATFDRARELCAIWEKGNEGHTQPTICTVNEQWLWLPSVLKMHDIITDGELGDLVSISMSGKGRTLEEELPRIFSHLLSVAIHRFTGYVEWASVVCEMPMCGKPVSAMLMSKQGIPVHLNLSAAKEGYSLRRCFLRLDGTKASLLARGGFLENLFIRKRMAGKWQRIKLPGVWQIEAGQEAQALADPDMNPTFHLLEMFAAAVQREGPNPYPPDRYLLVVKAMEMIRRSATEGCRISLGDLFA